MLPSKHQLIFQSNNERHQIKITQYADDTCVFLNSHEDIPNCLNQINDYTQVSGLKLNISKTEGLMLPNNETPNFDYGLKWPNTPIRYLGIFISTDMTQCQTLNWTSKLDKMQKLLDSWRTRKLTIMGKILIIKTLVLPKIIYSATMLPTPDFLTKTVNKLMYNFIWGKRDKIKRLILINKYENGGLNMIDLDSHLNAIKAAWVPRIYKGNVNSSWKLLPLEYINHVTKGYIQYMNFSNSKMFKSLDSIPEFYKEVIVGFCKSIKVKDIKSKTDLYESFIWGNQNFMVDNECLMSKSFINSNILFVKDILDEDGNLLPNIHHHIQNKNLFLPTISRIVQSLKPFKHLRFIVEQVNADIEDLTLEIYFNKKCKWFYEKIVSQKYKKNNMINRWSRILDCTFNCKDFYLNKMKFITEVKIAEFNYKIFNNILATGRNLYKWNKFHTDACIYCGLGPHDSRHLLYECIHLDNTWFIVQDVLRQQIDWIEIVLGINKKAAENCCISLICYIIYKKFLVDKDRGVNDPHIPLKLYLKRELTYKLETYKEIENTNSITRYITDIIKKLE